MSGPLDDMIVELNCWMTHNGKLSKQTKTKFKKYIAMIIDHVRLSHYLVRFITHDCMACNFVNNACKNNCHLEVTWTQTFVGAIQGSQRIHQSIHTIYLHHQQSFCHSLQDCNRYHSRCQLSSIRLWYGHLAMPNISFAISCKETWCPHPY
jgi:hypothetical protein